jgi:hypothetical protein
LGLTQAELKAASFADLQAKLTDQFSGANAAYLETYAGKLGLISTAAGEAQETIGKGLIDAFTILSSESGNITELTDAMNSFAEGTANAFRSVAILVSNLDKAMQAGFGLLGVLDSITGSNFVKVFGGAIGLLSTKGAGSFGGDKKAGMGGYPSSALGGTFVDPDKAKRDKIEADRLKIEKERAALEKKSLDNQKKQNALTKASKTLNLEAINIEAALKGKISETDRLSLFLQKAILEGNATLATQLSDQLDAAIKRNNELRLALLATPKAPNPYEDWKIPADLLAYTAATLGISAETVIKAPETIGTGMTDATQELIDALIAAAESQRKADAAQAAADAGDVYVSVKIGEDDIAAMITQSQTNSSLSGSFNQINRGNNKGAVAL